MRYIILLENSPLLSNIVNNIEIDPYTGEVYFGQVLVVFI